MKLSLSVLCVVWRLLGRASLGLSELAHFGGGSYTSHDLHLSSRVARTLSFVSTSQFSAVLTFKSTQREFT